MAARSSRPSNISIACITTPFSTLCLRGLRSDSPACFSSSSSSSQTRQNIVVQASSSTPSAYSSSALKISFYLKVLLAIGRAGTVASQIIYTELYCGDRHVILVVQAILYPCILASLILQVRIVYVDWPRARFIITIILALLAGGLEGCYIAYRHLWCSRPSITSMSLVYFPPKVAFDTCFTCVVCICCALLLFKLCFTIKTSVGFRGFLYFRPLQVLLVTIIICLIVPGNLLLMSKPLSNN